MSVQSLLHSLQRSVPLRIVHRISTDHTIVLFLGVWGFCKGYPSESITLHDELPRNGEKSWLGASGQSLSVTVGSLSVPDWTRCEQHDEMMRNGSTSIKWIQMAHSSAIAATATWVPVRLSSVSRSTVDPKVIDDVKLASFRSCSRQGSGVRVHVGLSVCPFVWAGPNPLVEKKHSVPAAGCIVQQNNSSFELIASCQYTGSKRQCPVCYLFCGVCFPKLTICPATPKSEKLLSGSLTCQELSIAAACQDCTHHSLHWPLPFPVTCRKAWSASS